MGRASFVELSSGSILSIINSKAVIEKKKSLSASRKFLLESSGTAVFEQKKRAMNRNSSPSTYVSYLLPLLGKRQTDIPCSEQ
jgi:hypothetical protein